MESFGPEEFQLATSLVETSNMALAVPSVVARPPGKVNLSLVVRGKRADGFHEIHTVMAAIDFCDHLTVSCAREPGIHLRCTGLSIPSGEDNLVYRAAKAIESVLPKPAALDIHLHKRIPSGAGLGGGGSGAATCLLAINHLLALRLNNAQLTELAEQIGSDVPFFLHGPVAVCTGRGEVVQPIEQRCTLSLLLILPEIQSRTAEVYSKYRYEAQRNDNEYAQVAGCLEANDIDQLARLGINSLTEAAMQLSQPLAELREKIESLGIGPLHLAGSGSSLFALGSSDETALWAKQLKNFKHAEIKRVRFQNQQSPFLEAHHEHF